MRTRYIVALTEAEQTSLKQLIAAGTAPVRKLLYSRILLKADQGSEGPNWVDKVIAELALFRSILGWCNLRNRNGQ